MTNVVNLKDYPGKGMRRSLPDGIVRIDRMSPYGNPYKITPRRDRAESLFLYRDYLEQRLQRDPTFLEPLRGKTLACWCRPALPCHGDVIASILDE